MVKKIFTIIFSFSLMVYVFSGCGNKQEAKKSEMQMQYVSISDLKDDITSASNEYIILDSRKEEDFNESHIVGAFLADQNAAVKEEKEEVGISNLKSALQKSTGEETGDNDKKYAIVCYSGNSYARKATELLIKIGVSSENIYTLEGGQKAWDEAGDEYASLLIKK